ncbi:MAG: flagellar biosynthetic protein FliR [Gemmatales bacterium]|nr:MAG: flagellar biosynthetic protein FliR [Gemmatales bacterium]
MIEPLVLYFGLVLARVGTFVTVFPLFNQRSLPRLVKIGLAVALTVMYMGHLVPIAQVPQLLQHSNVSVVAYLFVLGWEVFLGAVMGLAFGLFLVPAQIAGEFISQGLGLTFGELSTLTGESTTGPLSQIFEGAAILLFFGLDVHHVLLSILHASFGFYPIGGAGAELPVQRLIFGAVAAQEWGLALAMPVMLCLFTSLLILVLMTRAAPQLNLYSIGFPLQLAVGLTAVLLFAPNLVASMVGTMGKVSELLVGSFP